MKTGKYVTVRKAFQNYKQNKKKLAGVDFSVLSGIDYTKPRITADKTKNGQEDKLISTLDKQMELFKLVRLVEETLQWFAIEGFGKEKYIRLRMIDGLSETLACLQIGIAERTGRNWKRDVYEKAMVIGENIGVFQA